MPSMMLHTVWKYVTALVLSPARWRRSPVSNTLASRSRAAGVAGAVAVSRRPNAAYSVNEDSSGTL